MEVFSQNCRQFMYVSHMCRLINEANRKIMFVSSNFAIDRKNTAKFFNKLKNIFHLNSLKLNKN